MFPPHAAPSTTRNDEIADCSENQKWDWREHFGQPVTKDDSIWRKYTQVAIAHDKDMTGNISHNIDILLVF
ncbi:hypothetical protein FRC03_004602, partial [Tulasnella sp. 419]